MPNLPIRSQEYGKEARYIAVNELNVPERFYTYMVVNNIDGVKDIAMKLQDESDYHRNFSWPRLLAWAVFSIYTVQQEQQQTN